MAHSENLARASDKMRFGRHSTTLPPPLQNAQRCKSCAGEAPPGLRCGRVGRSRYLSLVCRVDRHVLRVVHLALDPPTRR
eukprot:2281519-Pleurochrysis_carterae.AAC.1